MAYPQKQSPEQWAAQLNFAALERKHGLPRGVLVNLVRQESGGDCKIFGPETRSGRAQGLCQFVPATAQEWGVDASDPVSSINGAARYLEWLMDRFGGDAEKAIAAYNWGPGNMRSLVRNHPNDWKQHLPKETKGYLANVSRGIGKSFVDRQRAGERMSDDELRDEEARRRAQLTSVGAASNLPADKILSDLFFAIFEMFAKTFEGIGDMIASITSDKPVVAMRQVTQVQGAPVSMRS